MKQQKKLKGRNYLINEENHLLKKLLKNRVIC